ncbi:GATA-binding transcription factor [Cavenderia fasciculata]|uniref:GATA-binding transcription factor n=1 Tax=Cavenderia fasciculata TaxID=261658 RepID=F4QEA2_CACFS|nr:GATA-binding transcription factor [Cavenderia fasciculata]EGG14049.1 GATA-binding transcription factor [Cavenderia fasciculata]|eukprot:XP_004350757.1 GATA-binding transcription factor [Cavenderia fasciculata]
MDWNPKKSGFGAGGQSSTSKLPFSKPINLTMEQRSPSPPPPTNTSTTSTSTSNPTTSYNYGGSSGGGGGPQPSSPIVYNSPQFVHPSTFGGKSSGNNSSTSPSLTGSSGGNGGASSSGATGVSTSNSSSGGGQASPSYSQPYPILSPRVPNQYIFSAPSSSNNNNNINNNNNSENNQPTSPSRIPSDNNSNGGNTSSSSSQQHFFQANKQTSTKSSPTIVNRNQTSSPPPQPQPTSSSSSQPSSSHMFSSSFHQPFQQKEKRKDLNNSYSVFNSEPLGGFSSSPPKNYNNNNNNNEEPTYSIQAHHHNQQQQQHQHQHQHQNNHHHSQPFSSTSRSEHKDISMPDSPTSSSSTNSSNNTSPTTSAPIPTYFPPHQQQSHQQQQQESPKYHNSTTTTPILHPSNMNENSIDHGHHQQQQQHYNQNNNNNNNNNHHHSQQMHHQSLSQQHSVVPERQIFTPILPKPNSSTPTSASAPTTQPILQVAPPTTPNSSSSNLPMFPVMPNEQDTWIEIRDLSSEISKIAKSCLTKGITEDILNQIKEKGVYLIKMIELVAQKETLERKIDDDRNRIPPLTRPRRFRKKKKMTIVVGGENYDSNIMSSDGRPINGLSPGLASPLTTPIGSVSPVNLGSSGTYPHPPQLSLENVQNEPNNNNNHHQPSSQPPTPSHHHHHHHQQQQQSPPQQQQQQQLPLQPIQPHQQQQQQQTSPPSTINLCASGNQLVPPPLTPSSAAAAAASAASGTTTKKKKAGDPLYCTSCGTTQTPEWRKGPAGGKSLCNACGLHYAKLMKKEGQVRDTQAKDPLNVGDQHLYGKLNLIMCTSDLSIVVDVHLLVEYFNMNSISLFSLVIRNIVTRKRIFGFIRLHSHYRLLTVLDGSELNAKMACIYYEDWTRVDLIVKNGFYGLLVDKLSAGYHLTGIDERSLQLICQHVVDTKSFLVVYQRLKSHFVYRDLIHYACIGGNLEIVRLLVHQTNPIKLDCSRMLEGAALGGHIELMTYIIAHVPGYQDESFRSSYSSAINILTAALKSSCPTAAFNLLDHLLPITTEQVIIRYHTIKYQCLMTGSEKVCERFLGKSHQCYISAFNHYINSYMMHHSTSVQKQMMYNLLAKIHMDDDSGQKVIASIESKVFDLFQRANHLDPSVEEFNLFAVIVILVEKNYLIQNSSSGQDTKIEDNSVLDTFKSLFKKVHQTFHNRNSLTILTAIIENPRMWLQGLRPKSIAILKKAQERFGPKYISFIQLSDLEGIPTDVLLYICSLMDRTDSRRMSIWEKAVQIAVETDNLELIKEMIKSGYPFSPANFYNFRWVLGARDVSTIETILKSTIFSNCTYPMQRCIAQRGSVELFDMVSRCTHFNVPTLQVWLSLAAEFNRMELVGHLELVLSHKQPNNGDIILPSINGFSFTTLISWSTSTSNIDVFKYFLQRTNWRPEKKRVYDCILANPSTSVSCLEYLIDSSFQDDKSDDYQHLVYYLTNRKDKISDMTYPLYVFLSNRLKIPTNSIILNGFDISKYQ